MDKEKIIEKYKGSVMAIRGFTIKGNYYVEDLLEDKIFNSLFFGELESRESDITAQGFNFLQEYYGFDKLAEMLYKDDPDFPKDSVEGNIAWLYSLRGSADEFTEEKYPDLKKEGELHKKYHGKKLGGLEKKNLFTSKTIDLTADRANNDNYIAGLMDNLYTGDLILNQDGKNYFKEFWGYDYLVELIIKNRDNKAARILNKYKTKVDIDKWLREVLV